MTLKQSYSAWKQCLFVERKQPFTKEYIQQRIVVLEDSQSADFKKVEAAYGLEYTQQIIDFFKQALKELQ